jgi:hypothetical protein
VSWWGLSCSKECWCKRRSRSPRSRSRPFCASPSICWRTRADSCLCLSEMLA